MVNIDQTRRRILIGPSSFAATSQAPLRVLKEAGLEIVENPYKRRYTKEEITQLLSDNIVGLIAGLEPLDRDVLSASKLKALSRCGSGMSNVDTSAAKELGIAVRSTPDAPVEAVAELTLAGLLSLMRHIPFMDREMRDGRWSKRIGMELRGKTVAIVGFGRIGQRVAALLAPFETKNLVVDPFLKTAPDGAQAVTLEEALKRADVVTLHCSGETPIIGAGQLALMRKEAVLLNAARGTLVDHDALVAALRDQRIAGAWIDTFADEPYSGALKELPNAIVTPHVGSYTRECRLQMETEAAKNLVEALAG